MLEAETFGEGLDDQIVGRPLSLARAARQLLLEGGGEAKQNVSGLGARDAPPAGGLEGDSEPGGEDLDRHVVQVASARHDLFGEAAL